MATPTTSITSRTIRLTVPGVLERPAVGTSCCASTAEAIIAQELSMLPGVEDVAVDTATGVVTMTYDTGALDGRTIADAMDDIGYPASETQTVS